METATVGNGWCVLATGLVTAVDGCCVLSTESVTVDC